VPFHFRALLPFTLLACTVDSEDGATSLGDPTYGTTVAMTTTVTTSGTTMSSSTTESESSGGEAESESGSSDPESEGSSGGGTDSSGGGVDEQPADGMYSECDSAIDCFGVQGCVAVMPNVGFCTNGGCADAASCDASPGGTATPACVAALLNGTDQQVCALDCSGGKTCPGGMECAALDAAMVCV